MVALPLLGWPLHPLRAIGLRFTGPNVGIALDLESLPNFDLSNPKAAVHA